MKTTLSLAFAAAALLLTPGALFAVDQFTTQGVKNDQELQQDLNGRTGFGPMERNSKGALINGPLSQFLQKLHKDIGLPDGATVQPNGSILGTDGSERMLENIAPFSLQSGVKPDLGSLPPGYAQPSQHDDPQLFPPDASADFQD